MLGINLTNYVGRPGDGERAFRRGSQLLRAVVEEFPGAAAYQWLFARGLSDWGVALGPGAEGES